jgi:hypothetical protein
VRFRCYGAQARLILNFHSLLGFAGSVHDAQREVRPDSHFWSFSIVVDAGYREISLFSSLKTGLFAETNAR